MDPNNPVVVLCAAGMQAEADGELDEAAETFQQAWAVASDDFERCVASHYLARHQPTPELALEWNQRCLELAEAVGDDRVDGFFPSLYLNLGKSHEDLGHRELALEFYRRAQMVVRSIPESPYRTMLAGGIARGLARVDGD
jgi:tetratricopeptide (TPR) repeat protein